MVWRQKQRRLFLEKLFSTYQPRKLYCGLRVEFNQIILHVWQGGRKLTPAKYEYSFNEFRSNSSMLELIQLQLGPIWLHQLLALITGKGTSLLEMPETFLTEMSQYLSMPDLLRLSSTCVYMNKFYSLDDIWKPIFGKFLKSICTYSDYNHVQNNGGYKQVCHKICSENKEKDYTKNLLHSNHIILGSSPAKMHLSLSSNRFEQCSQDSPKHSQSNPLLEYEDNSELVPRVSKSEVMMRFDSESIGRSQCNKATVSHSASSLNHSSDKLDCYLGNEHPKEETPKKSEGVSCLQTKDDFYFTRSDLKRRLKCLNARSEKYQCEDDFLPGDKTLKYSLKHKELR